MRWRREARFYGSEYVSPLDIDDVIGRMPDTDDDEVEEVTEHKEKIIRVVEQYTKQGELIKVWNTVNDAEAGTGVLGKNIYTCLRGKTRTAGGYGWKYRVVEHKTEKDETLQEI